MYRVFGIRHHGPGSARQLLQALDDWRPDCLLIEAPADAQAELEKAAQLELEPPVALVLYDEQDLQRAIYYPFARFSPEWVALRWAARQPAAVPIVAMDLPVAWQLAPQPSALLHPAPDATISRDPLGVAASLAGYSDSEQWWDHTFERQADDLARFDALLELITSLREAFPQADAEETLTREAHMRKMLRKALKQGHERIAIVCGAWHAPALHALPTYKAGPDSQRLRGLPKVKVKAAWIPWSYPRLARQGGYGAGVNSPAWYALLFDYQREAPIHWMVKAARLLREDGFDTSPAHAQEAVRLARNLSALRGQPIPALDDLLDATLSTLCQGKHERLELIKEKLAIGDRVGYVPAKASQVPLEKDMQAQLKASRLNKYWGKVGEQWLKATKTDPQGKIDLRQPTDLHKSRLLYQLQLIGIPWGQVRAGNGRDLGAFKEVWRLSWQPEFALRIMEAAMWGNTVAEAAAHRLINQPEDASLLSLAQAVLHGLRAGLGEAVPDLVARMNDQAALSRDITELLAALPALGRIIQYGDARRTDVTKLALLTESMIPRVAIGLAGSATNLDEEGSQTLQRDLLRAHRMLMLLDLPATPQHWWPAIGRLANLPGIPPLLKGTAVRLLFDQQMLDLEGARQRLAYATSPGNPPLEVALWLSGFLQDSGLLLLHHPPLWQVVDEWVHQLDWADLEHILPLLRRTFSQIGPDERRRILARVRHASAPNSSTPNEPTPSYPAAIGQEERERAVVISAGLSRWLSRESGQ